LITQHLRVVLEDGTVRVGMVGVLLVFSSLMNLAPVPAGVDPGWLFLVPVAISSIGSGLREGLLVAVGASLLCGLYATAAAAAGDVDGLSFFLGAFAARLALLGMIAAVLGAFAEAHLSVQSNLRELATTDPLTRVANVASFYDAMGLVEGPDSRLALVVIDVDDLKTINDRHGHQWGSATIQAVANALRSCVRAGDLVARFGGDEFVIMLRDADRAGAELVVDRVREHLRAGLTTTTTHIPVSVSAGIAVYGEEGTTTDDLLAAADEAMYSDKRARKTGRAS
jgi:diguanylate cyclase (GGDEF)-like protein